MREREVPRETRVTVGWGVEGLGLGVVVGGSRMSDRKGLLSQELSGSSTGGVQGLRRVSFGRERNHAEIKKIFSQEREAMSRSTIFGCSPPVRSSNPVPSDSKFLTHPHPNTFPSLQDSSN